MRHLTGGRMADSGGGSAVGLVNRKLSPYNTVGSSSASTIHSIFKRATSVPHEFSAALSKYSTDYVSPPLGNTTALVGGNLSGDVATVTQASDNVLEAGIPIYANSIGIATANTFMTVFFSALILIAITLGVLALGYLVIFVLARSGKHKGAVVMKYRFPTIAQAWGLRVVS